ncbi:multi-sensor signal transduction histidine kinase [Paramagnetospirillum caucaseum]|uniref:histidine kinase n=2 Tax=Paramagnetospirillum caucaseum TaxID=1244869 RepID=M2ZUJ0_9PROT|nr:multi-sensor signal transduction histidine kinase [Paramagnetospirillum caucaseum]
MAVSDGVIAASYISISVAIAVYIVKRRDIYLRWVAMAFALFILLCAASHLSDLWTLWSPDYGIQAMVKAITALVSLLTAIALWPLIPHALSLPSAAQLATANTALGLEIVERRAAEASLRETELELRAANAELDSFAYAVSHDLRAPLRAMIGFSTALDEDHHETLDKEAQHYLAQIIRGGKHMGDLIDGLLHLSRATRGELQRTNVDVSALAASVRDMIKAAGTYPTATWNIEPGLTIWGDARLIELVMQNLLENAAKYSAKAADPTIRVYGQRDEDATTICVSDNGAGFDMAHADKLFAPFQRLHRQDEFPGIGIGLSTVGRIIQRHGGTISAEASIGTGATFMFSLPQSKMR